MRRRQIVAAHRDRVDDDARRLVVLDDVGSRQRLDREPHAERNPTREAPALERLDVAGTGGHQIMVETGVVVLARPHLRRYDEGR
jgi:hypothetical protein